MDDAELEALLVDVESERVERKASFTDTDRAAQAICAFSNDLAFSGLPGVLFFGADDRTGRPTGLTVDDALLLRLADLRSSGKLQPIPSLTVEKRHLLGGDMAVVIVRPASAPPVRYQGQTWVRVGPRRAIATMDDERRLSERRRARDLPFDARPANGASLADLDLRTIDETILPGAIDPEVLASNGRTRLEQLASLRLATLDGVPTWAGILAAGRDPVDWLPGAYVQFLRIDGTTVADEVTDAKELSGGLGTVARQLDEVLRLNGRTRVQIVGTDREVRTADVPLAALRQIARNALMHRTYETNAPVRVYWFTDRVEVHSPGGPYGIVTRENFGRPGASDYRNPVIAEMMRSLGIVQRFGVGLGIAAQAMEANGNPPMSWDVTDSFVVCTLPAI